MSESRLPTRWVAPSSPAVPPIKDSGPIVEQESTLKSVLQLVALLRRHWLLVGTIALASVAILYYQVRNEPHLYRATAVIRLADKGRELSNGISRQPMMQPYRPFTDPLLSQIQVLRSEAVAESVVVREGLRLRSLPSWSLPTFLDSVTVSSTAPNDSIALELSDSTVVARTRGQEIEARYGQRLGIAGVAFTIVKNPGFRSALLAVIPARDAANDVRGSLSATPRERTDVIDVTYTATSPQVAQRLANAAVRVFQSLNAEGAKEESVRRRQFIAQQLQKTEKLLDSARDARNEFRSRERVFSSQDKFRSQQADLSAIELRRQDLLVDRATYSSLLNELQASHDGATSTERLSALAASPGIAANAVVSHLFAQLLSLQSARDSLTTGRWSRSPSDPDVQRLDALIASTESKVISGARSNIAALDARIASLDSQRRGVSAGIAGLPEAEAQEAALTAQVETYGRQVDRLRDELQSAQIAEAAEAGQVEIVDLAESSGVPIGTGRRPKLALALLIGLGLGGVVAYVLENYRPVIRRRDELEEAMKVPNLALVPQIRRLDGTENRLLQAARRLEGRFKHENGNGAAVRARGQNDLVTLSDTRSSGAEAYRTLRTNLLFSAAVHALHRIVVTSPGPEEGKSTTAANLAIAFAQQGQRVLLIDCDLRRARIHRIFEESSLPGLTSVLAAGEPLAKALRATRVEGLMILPAGPLPPNPAELLGSAQMQQLLETLSESFDMLILDTPPLLAASDAAIVSRMTDGALVVVRAGRTERSALQTAVQQLATVGARVLGTVLNDPDAEVPKYARYYGYYYNNYYDYSNGTAAHS